MIQIVGESFRIYGVAAMAALVVVAVEALKLWRKGSYGGPVSYPILGCLLALRRNQHRLYDWLTEELRKSPSQTIRLTTPFATIIPTANPANVEHILRTRFHNYVKGQEFHHILEDLLGDGIFNVDKDLWRIQRKAALGQFSGTLHRQFLVDTVQKELQERLIPIATQAAVAGEAIDMQDLMMRFGFDVICQITCGVDPFCLDPSLKEVEFAQAFDMASSIAFTRFTSLSWRLKRALDIGEERTMREAVQKVNSFVLSIVDKVRKEKERGRDLLSRFMNEGEKEELSDEFLKDMVISFLFAGKDSSSSALSWFFRFLCKHGEVQEKIHKEVSSLKGGSKEGGFTMEEVKQMHYLQASLAESMRLYPPVPLDSKYALEEDVLPDGTRVRKGERVSYNVYAMGRMEKVWGEDCMEFKPQRWLGEDGKYEEVKPWSKYPVFQGGPRTCVGKEMAFIQMKCIVAGLLLRFRVSSSGEEEEKEPPYDLSFVMRMKQGMHVTLTPRIHGIDSL